MASAGDPQVLAKPAADGFTLITADQGDFGRELALTRAAEPSVVLSRQPPDIIRAADVAALLLANLTPAVVSALGAGAFVVFTPAAVRVQQSAANSLYLHLAARHSRGVTYPIGYLWRNDGSRSHDG